MGGGATGVTQSNDTDLHKQLRSKYSDEEAGEMVNAMRRRPGQVPSPRPEDHIEWMARVWSEMALHRTAEKGFKYTGAMNALDGTEDHLICTQTIQNFRKLSSYNVGREANKKSFERVAQEAIYCAFYMHERHTSRYNKYNKH